MADQVNESYQSDMSLSFESDSMHDLTAQSQNYGLDQTRILGSTENPELRGSEKRTGTSGAWSEVKNLRNAVSHIFERLDEMQKEDDIIDAKEVYKNVEQLRVLCSKYWRYIEMCSEEVETFENVRQAIEVSERSLLERVKETVAKSEEAARSWKKRYENAVEELELTENALRDQDRNGDSSRTSRRPAHGQGNEIEDTSSMKRLKQQLEAHEKEQKEAEERWRALNATMEEEFGHEIETYKEHCAQMANKTEELSTTLDLLREDYAVLENKLECVTNDRDLLEQQKDSYETERGELIHYIQAIMEELGQPLSDQNSSTPLADASPRRQLSLSDALRMFVTSVEDRFRALSQGRGDDSAIKRLSPRHLINAVSVQLPPGERQQSAAAVAPKETIVYKEVPVEVIKEVPVEVIKEVVVEKVVEVPVEKIVEVVREIPVEVIREAAIDYTKLAEALSTSKADGSIHLHFHQHGHQHAHRHNHTHNHVYAGLTSVGQAERSGELNVKVQATEGRKSPALATLEKSHVLTTGVHLKARAKRTETARVGCA